jgi:hypothetical protein
METRKYLQLYISLFLIFISYTFNSYVKIGSRIKFNNETKLISNKTELKIILNKQILLHEYLCENIKDNLHDSICKYDLNKFHKFLKFKNFNYKEAETMINILYKSNSNICYNIFEFLDFHKKTINLHTIINDCNEFQITNDYNKSYLYHIYNSIKLFLNVFFTLLSIITIFNIYKEIKKNKKQKSIRILNQIKYSNELDICSICHDSYKPESTNIRELNSCKHVYHLECINSWLITYKQKNCPMCNTKCY